MWLINVIGSMADCLLITAGQLAWTIVKGPMEAIAGILYGILFGVILWYLPHKKHVSIVFLFYCRDCFYLFHNCISTAT